jgi:hypothetical protein
VAIGTIHQRRGFRDRTVAANDLERANGRIDGIDPLQVCGQDVDGADLARLNQRGQRRCGLGRQRGGLPGTQATSVGGRRFP